MPKRAVFERSCRELSLDVSVGVHILLAAEQSSLESQSRGCAKTPILSVYIHTYMVQLTTSRIGNLTRSVIQKFSANSFLAYVFRSKSDVFSNAFLRVRGYAMPRHIPDHPDSYAGWNGIASFGSMVSSVASSFFFYVVLLKTAGTFNMPTSYL